MKAPLYLFLLLLISTFNACNNDNDEQINPINYTYTFDTDAQSWQGDFADYPITDSIFYELAFSYSTLPQPLDIYKGSLKITGNNHSDDLFMFIKRQITGLKPNTNYNIRFNIQMASCAPTNAAGVGGAPGESVYLKAGAAAIEPKKIVNNDEPDMYRMNIDKANQAQSGNDMAVIGNVGVADNTTQFTLVDRSNSDALFKAKTDAEGKIWVIIGTDSGFESTTTLYFSNIAVSFFEVK
jgi:hypothetical protein